MVLKESIGHLLLLTSLLGTKERDEQVEGSVKRSPMTSFTVH